MMKIYINGRFLEYNLTGVVRYSLAVLNELDKIINNNIEFCLLVPPNVNIPISFKNIVIKNVGVNNGALWEQYDILKYSKDGWLLSLASTGPILKKRQIIVMHDAKMARKWKSDASFKQRYFLFFMGIFLGKLLKRIITISNYAKKELVNYFYINPSKITVAFEGYEHILNIEEDNNILYKYNLKNNNFILAVGGGSAKNNLLTAKAMQLIDNKNIKLVLTGNIPNNVKDNLKKYNNVELIGRVTDEELVSLYKNAICLCFPSVAEGFGIPPIEAMALGCPVIVSNRDSLPEVCGEAALYCDVNDVNSLVKQLNLVINNEEVRDKLIEKGKLNLKRFSWEKTSKIILNEIKKTII